MEIFSFSPTTKRIKSTEETEAVSRDPTSSTSASKTMVVEGSADKPEESNDLVLTSAVTTPEAPPKTTPGSAMATMVDDQLLTTTPKENQIEVEGSGGGEKSGEMDHKSHSMEQEDDEDPLSEVVTMATPILQREMTKEVEITITGTNGGVVEVEGNLSRGDMIRGVVISGNSRKVSREEN